MSRTGRPIEYGPHIIEKAKNYLATCEDDDSNPLRLKVKLPSIFGLALFLDVNRTTIYEWKTKYSDFSNIVDRIEDTQAEKLVNNGLSGAYNSQITKAMLSKHGVSEKSEVEHSGNQDKPIITKIVREIVKK